MKRQKQFALSLLEYHGGQSSGLYAVGSCMLSDSEKGRKYSPSNHRGHDLAVKWAMNELLTMKKSANFPECVSSQMEKECNKLAKRLEKFTGER